MTGWRQIRSALATLTALAACSAATLAARDASAFCRTRALDGETRAKYPDPSIYEAVCPRGADGCCSDGPVVYWRSSCIGYSLQEDASAHVPFDLATSTAAAAFARWPAARCDASGGHPSITAKDLGSVVCGEVKYDTTGANQNVIVFRDDAAPGGDSRTLGLTTVTYFERTGEIVDADMEINSFNFKYLDTDTRTVAKASLAIVMSHEAGHFYGLAHSLDSSALMWADDSRTGGGFELGPDDVAGICTIYAPDGRRKVDAPADASGYLAASACDPTPRRGFTRACVAPAQGTSGADDGGGCCAVAPGSSRGHEAERTASALGALGMGALALVARRRRRRA